MAMNVWVPGCAVINTVTLPQVQSMSLNAGVQTYLNFAGGSPDPSFAATQSVLPTANLSFTSIKAILDLTGFRSLAIGATALLYFNRMAAGGNRTTGHSLVTLNDGIVIPRRLSASGNGEATITVDIIATYDGTNDPAIYTTSVSLPASSLIASQKYTVGGVKFGSTIYEAQSIDVDFGMKEYVQYFNGEAFARFAAIQEQQIVITVTSNDLALYDLVGEEGSEQTSAAVFFKEIASGGTRTALATTQHISITAGKSNCKATTIQGSNNQPVGVSIVMQPIDNTGANTPVVLSTAAAIA